MVGNNKDQNLNLKQSSFKVALIYCLIGALWIIITGDLVKFFPSNLAGKLELYKGLFYVLITGTIAYYASLKALNKIFESNLKYQILVNSIDEIVFTLNLDNIFTNTYGSGFKKLLKNYPVKGSNFYDFFSCKNEQGKYLVQEVIKKEKLLFECSLEGCNDKTILLQVQLTPLLDLDSNVIGILGIGRDITKEKIEQKKLLESKNNLKEAQALAKIGSWDFDLANNIAKWSDEMYNIFEVDKQNFKASYEESITLIHPDDRDMVDKAFTAALKERKIYDITHRVLMKDGRIKYLHEKCTTEYDEKGIPFRSLGTTQDITEFKKMEIKLENERLRSKTIINTIPELLWLKDINGVYLACNPQFELFFGAKENEIIGKTDFDFVPKDLAEFFRENDKQCLDLGKSRTNFEWVNYASDGHKALLETIKTPMYDFNGNLIGVLGVAHDITELHNSQESIKKLNQELEERVQERTQQLEMANKDLESFAYSVSHDLRAPLRHINGFTKILRNKISQNTEELEILFNKITNAAYKMSTMIEELLKFSRLGRKSVEKANVDLNILVSQIIEQYKIEYEDRKIEFKVTELPIVSGDHTLLQTVFENLISNAIKFTSKKDKAIIEIGVLKEEEKVQIYIKDNGAGFDMSYQDKLFGVFQRLHTESEFEGTGIGLANVKQIITKHGGSIRAEGEIDKGATFYITL